MEILSNRVQPSDLGIITNAATKDKTIDVRGGLSASLKEGFKQVAPEAERLLEVILGKNVTTKEATGIVPNNSSKITDGISGNNSSNQLARVFCDILNRLKCAH